MHELSLQDEAWMTNQFDSKGGGQNVAQGDHAIGRQVNVTQELRGDGCICSGTGNVTVNGIPPALFAEYAGKLAVTDSALASFFKILEEQQVPLSDLDSKLRKIAAQHKALLARLEIVQSADPQVVRLKGEALQAIEAGDYAKAEDLLNQAEARDVQAIEGLEQAARQRRISAAASCAVNAKLQEMQFRYKKAAEYWQRAAALLPEENYKPDHFKTDYLYRASLALIRIAKYSEAVLLCEQILAICGPKGEYAVLDHITRICYKKGDYGMALKYQEQLLVWCWEYGYREGVGWTLNRIGKIYYARGDHAAAMRHLKHSLTICREVGDRACESVALSNISQIYNARGDYGTALKYLEQSLVISREIGDRRGEAETSWNIGRTYEDQGDLAKAEPYISRAVELAEEIGHPKLEEWRKHSEALHAKLRGK
jgi:tetratricopeptide (TPR) repeat protein